MNAPIGAKNRRVVVVLMIVVAAMTGLSFASVPLYRLFCQTTGYGGTTQRADRGADQILNRIMTVRFNADISRELPWEFRPEQRQVKVRLGESTLISYRAENRGKTNLVGTAVFNVQPASAGRYFNKIQCFCFTQQELAPGQAVDLPVYFFVDPALAKDRDLDGADTITLSYTFYPAESSALDRAVQTSVDPSTPSLTIPAAGAPAAVN